MTPKTAQKLFSTYILRIIAGYILCLMPTVAQGQDLIVTTKGDSIHCKITEIKPDYLRYAHIEDDEVAKAFIPAAWVVSYQQEYILKQ